MGLPITRKDKDSKSCDVSALADLLGLLGDKWTVAALISLASGRKRFGEIRTDIDDLNAFYDVKVSQRMLALTLKRMERFGIVTREAYPTIPPKVEYALTNVGESLIEPMNQLAEWATGNRHLTCQSVATIDPSDSEQCEHDKK